MRLCLLHHLRNVVLALFFFLSFFFDKAKIEEKEKKNPADCYILLKVFPSEVGCNKTIVALTAKRNAGKENEAKRKHCPQCHREDEREPRLIALREWPRDGDGVTWCVVPAGC